MNAYQIKTALTGMNREKWINFISVLTIATGLLMAAVAYLAVYNVKLAAGRLPERFSITVFLDDALQETEARAVAAEVKRLKSVKDAVYMSKEEALHELKQTLADADYILEGLAENPLSASLDVKLTEGAVTNETVRSVADEIKKVKGVALVEYGEKLLNVIQSAQGYADSLGTGFLAIIGAGIIFVCYSTVKILLYRKRDEIEILKVLGATKWFIRGPFIIEGGLIGVLGGITSSFGLVALKIFLFDQMTVTMPILKSLSAPPDILFALPLGGLLIGVFGALMAVGMIRY